jgi:glycosyltransferase involved in cell wall biosynthesis
MGTVLVTKVCIFTYGYMYPHHTMVNFHIENLFDRNSCVVCEFETDYQTVSRPRLIRSNIDDNFADKLLKVAEKYKRKLIKLPANSILGTERRRIVEFLHKEKVDVILCEFGCIGADVAHSIGDLDIPIFTYFRGYDATMRVRSARQRNLISQAFKKMHGAIFVSAYLRDNLASYGLVHPNSYILPSGVNTDRFSPREKTKGKFVAVGRLIEKKRPDITVESFCKEAKQFPEARLDIFGGGPMLESCRDIVHRQRMENQIFFHGEQKHDAIIEHVSRAEFFLQHSVTSQSGDAEGAPTSIQEALACGCTVLATRHAGIPDLISEGSTGFLVEELDIDGYRKLIRAGLSGQIDTVQIAADSHNYAVLNLDNRKLITHLEQILKHAVN